MRDGWENKNRLGGAVGSPMQHLWQPFVSGIFVVKANLLRRRQQSDYTQLSQPALL